MLKAKSTRWALFTTNYGRSAITTLELFSKNKLGSAEIGFVLYENLPSGASQVANEMGIQTERVIKSDFPDRKEFEKHIVGLLIRYQIDFIFLLGFGYFLKYDLIKKYQGKVINIHPALLPAFPGKRAMQQALNYGVKVTGITTHIIDDKLDEGEIICQIPIPIEKDESLKTLDAKFMKEASTIIMNTFREIQSR